MVVPSVCLRPGWKAKNLLSVGHISRREFRQRVSDCSRRTELAPWWVTPLKSKLSLVSLGLAARSELPFCALGSVKSMISHLIPAAGIASLIKCALSLYHRVLPPTLNVENPHPDVQKTTCYLNTETRPWVHGQETPRRAGVNAFGFGGINAHAIMEEYPINPANYTVCQHHWPTEVCILQAESRLELIRECERVERFVAASSALELKDIAYSLTCKLRADTTRLSIVASTVSDLIEKLARARVSLQDPTCAEIKDPGGIYYTDRPLAKEGKLAFVFPGEGAQYSNMLSELSIHFPLIRTWFDIIERTFLQKGSKLLPSHLLYPPTLETFTAGNGGTPLGYGHGAGHRLCGEPSLVFPLVLHRNSSPSHGGSQHGRVFGIVRMRSASVGAIRRRSTNPVDALAQ